MRSRSRIPLGLALICLLGSGLSQRSAAAQASGGAIDLQLFRPAMDSQGYITLNSSSVLGHLEPSFTLMINWSRYPLALSGQSSGVTWCRDATSNCQFGDDNYLLSRYDVQNMVTGNLQAAIGLWKHWELGLGVPVTWWDGDTAPNPLPGDGPKDGHISAQGVGDISVSFKGRLLDLTKNPLGLALVGTFFLPTADEDKWLGSGRRLVFDPQLIVDTDFFSRRLSFTANVGARLRSDAKTWKDERNCAVPDDLTQQADCGTGMRIENRHDFIYGAGLSLALVPERFDFVAEWIGQTGFEHFGDTAKLGSANQVQGGFKVHLTRATEFSFGVGRGLHLDSDNHQYGSPDMRVYAGLIVAPLAGEGDADGDGVSDADDLCPSVREDRDWFQDSDGCPDLDNDGDGISDAQDRCPLQPETFNNYQDQDGCPDVKPPVGDRDKDGIPDDKDKCVDAAEDKDGFEDQDGCPDLDNDKDGISDLQDQCPNEPETFNGNEDEDGCPDQGRVIVRKDRIEILDKIFFQTGKAKIKPVSFPLLDAIAATMKGTPRIKLVEIQGHADERGNDAYNLKLTDARARAVRDYLVKQGVEAERLQSKGYGETRPLDEGHNEAAWSKNRRVEFMILKQDTELEAKPANEAK